MNISRQAVLLGVVGALLGSSQVEAIKNGQREAFERTLFRDPPPSKPHKRKAASETWTGPSMPSKAERKQMKTNPRASKRRRRS